MHALAGAASLVVTMVDKQEVIWVKGLVITIMENK